MTAWIPLLLQGTITTCKIWLCSTVISLFVGISIGTVRCSWLRTAALAVPLGILTLLLRGIPLYAQLMIVYFVLPQLTNITFSPFTAGIITLGLCSAAHVSEVIRGTLNSIPRGQWQAAQALGYTNIQQLRFIILPQAFRAALPALINEYVMVMKSTSILASIGTLELTKMSMNIMYRSFNPLGVSLSIAGIYLALTCTVSLLGQLLERKYNVSRTKSFL